MRIEVKGRNLQVTDELREWIERRFDKVGKQVSDQATLEVEVADERVPGEPIAAEAVLHVKGTSLRAKAVGKDAKSSINAVSEDMARQVKRHRDKRRGRRESRAAAEQSRTGAQEAPVFEEEPTSSL